MDVVAGNLPKQQSIADRIKNRLELLNELLDEAHQEGVEVSLHSELNGRIILENIQNSKVVANIKAAL